MPGAGAATALLCGVPGDSGSQQEPKNGAVEMGTEVAVLSPWAQTPLKGAAADTVVSPVITVERSETRIN